MKILRAKDYQRMPWKNGGGETSEIMAFPEGSDLSNFGWRISMAHVASNGPFSNFLGIDRTLTILRGEGLSLMLGAEKPILLSQDSAPHSFPADILTSATLAGGPVIDLNVMTRRGQFTHQVERLTCEAIITVKELSGTTLIFCAKGNLELADNEGQMKLEANDCAILSSKEPHHIKGKALAYRITINAADSLETNQRF
jgi:uncharacterized protein